jgi:NADP-dependent 3-hydroxy acid dehydrogenase YdfG
METNTAFLPQKISGKRILITGGTTGIGRATAQLLASEGAKIFIFGRNQEQLDETISAIQQSGAEGECYGMVADVAEPNDIKKVFGQVDAQLGGLDILINNAALAYQSVMEGSYEDWSYIIHTNLLGYMACSHEAVKRMQNDGGQIVNVGSMSADVREEDSSVYVATKSAIQGFSEALRKEVNPKGIKVTLIEPGAVDTDMQDGSSEDKLKKIENMEMLEAKDIANSILYCLCQEKRTAVVSMQIRPLAQLI